MFLFCFFYLLKSKSKCTGPRIPKLSLMWPLVPKELLTSALEHRFLTEGPLGPNGSVKRSWSNGSQRFADGNPQNRIKYNLATHLAL